MTTPPYPETGLVFPSDAQGQRSSTAAGARIVAAALRALNLGRLAQAAEAERHWRRRYPDYFRALVEGGLARPDLALASASAGLQAAWQTLRWQSRAGAEQGLVQALERPEGESLSTLTLRGAGAPSPQPWHVPYQGRHLQGDALLEQLLRWVEAGVIEPSAARALGRCVRHPEWFDLSDRHLALLGAASEAGPLRWLARWRANLYAVDVDRADVWSRISDLVLVGNATLHLPLRASGHTVDWMAAAGVDLLREAPRVAQWLRGFGRPMDLAALGYLDGERHVRLSLAMDMVASQLLSAQPASSLAYLATPTDVYAVPEEAALAAQAAYGQRPLLSRGLQSPLRLAAGERFFHANVGQLLAGPQGRRYGVADSLILEQGPNYALAKRLQQWRALWARSHGHRVSLNVAPSTTTGSVVKNPALAAGFAGASAFGIEVFQPETTNALMAALWVHDLRTDRAPSDPQIALAHPYELIMDQACHGGLWRSAYRPRSALPFAAALGWVRERVGR
ncbi:hypothetical protein HNQ51_000928 [Inhella inkyongensis]|uniref:Uncharacterized protein n=1 Tax=Inhella inkyongensis TaxID=392593 RepID=A0A840S062_9BURK|nr:hypothetical protein [Inhella inkyongensis]MBB5203635.1 hypothetical protein [Inhella inkyongensis]